MLSVMSPRHFRGSSNLPFDIESHDPFDNLHHAMLARPNAAYYAPTLSVLPKVEAKDAYTIRVETPGVKKEDLKVELLGRRILQVTVADDQVAQPGEETAPTDAEQPAPARPRATRSAYKLCKRVDVPRDADCSKLQLTYADGLLTVEVGKKSKEGGTQEYGDKVGELQAEVTGRLAKVEALRLELEEEQRAAVKAKNAIREAKMEFARAVAEERMELAIDGTAQS